jgi:hypothetical protein
MRSCLRGLDSVQEDGGAQPAFGEGQKGGT